MNPWVGDWLLRLRLFKEVVLIILGSGSSCFLGPPRCMGTASTQVEGCPDQALKSLIAVSRPMGLELKGRRDVPFDAE